MEKKRILLPTKKFFKASEEDLNLSIEFDTTDKLLREGDKDIVLNINELFNEERNKSKNYKIYGKIKMIFKNMYSGTTTYEPLLRHLYTVSDEKSNEGYIPYNEFAFLRNDILRETNNTKKSDTIPVNPMEIKLSGTEYTGHTVTTSIESPTKNWNLYLSYVYDKDNNFPMKYTLSGSTTPLSFVSGDGIPFRVEKFGKTYVLTSPVEHGMNVGEYIVISGSSISAPESGRTFNILSVGNEIHNSEKYVLEIPSGITINDTIVTGKRCLDIKNISGSTSTYYVHKHKTLTNVGDYIIDNTGFEKNIWEEERKLVFENYLNETDVLVQKNRMETILYDFKDPFVLDNLLNNLGYTPTEIFVTVILRNGNGYFNYPPKVGYSFNFHNTWIDAHFSGLTSEESTIESEELITNNVGDFYSGKILDSGTTLTGAFIEYNDIEMKERIISESFHKFSIVKNIFNHNQDTTVNSFSGATPNNPFGLYYQPHYRVKLRQLSPYIETSDTDNVYNLPENTKYSETEKLWKWRDLYDHGYIDPDGFGTNFPFSNNIHYVKNDINFFLRNERYYTNKTDGVTDFNNKKIKINC